jgi:oligoribonuclease (3'-5' exoribonuclease)
LKGVNKSKSQSLWALDRDSDDIITEESLNTDNLLRILNEKIESAFKKDNKGISEVAKIISRSHSKGLSRNSKTKQEARGVN